MPPRKCYPATVTTTAATPQVRIASLLLLLAFTLRLRRHPREKPARGPCFGCPLPPLSSRRLADAGGSFAPDFARFRLSLGKMTAASCLVYLSGSILCSSCRPLSVHQSSKCQFQFLKVSRRPIQHSSSFHTHIKYASSGRGGHQGLPSDSGSDHEPFFLSMIKDVAWSLKCLANFLAEQPSQLKYIEWPTFQNTLKTATLTLVLVALLIVALSTVDSSLCYVLALLLRKTT